MAINWIDTSKISINALLLLERIQISWLFSYVPAQEISAVLNVHQHIEWYFVHACPELADTVRKTKSRPYDTDMNLRQHEQNLLEKIADWLVYALNPASYDEQAFTKWDSAELLDLADFSKKTVIDVGAGTGRLAFTVADKAATVYCVEPVSRLRDYIKEKARKIGISNLYALDGLITQIPFADNFADIVVAGHVFGDAPDQEQAELERVVKPDGLIILCPGNSDKDNDVHNFLVGTGYTWSVFEEPEEGRKRKYWKRCSTDNG